MPFAKWCCNTCKTVYSTIAEAEKCERIGHRPHAIWPNKHPRKTAAPLPTEPEMGGE